jgi:hypothetical protein
MAGKDSRSFTPSLFNVSTRKAESLPDDQLEQAIASGTHAYKKGTIVNVIKPDGEAASVTADELPAAIGEGAKIERPEEYAVRKYVEANPGAKGAAKVASRAFLDGLTFGVSGAVERGTLDPLELAKNRALAKSFEGVELLSSLAGGVASLPVGGPLIGASAKLGAKAATAALGPATKAVGAKIGQKSLEGMGKNIARKTIEMGVEGAVLSAPAALTEAAFGNPKEAGETLLFGLGLGAALGVPTGVAGGTFARIQARKARIAAEAAEIAERGAAAEARAAADVGEVATKRIGQVEQIEPLFDVGEAAETIRKRTTPEYFDEAAVKAFADEGINAPAYAKSRDQFPKVTAADLARSPSPEGRSIADELQKLSDDTQDVATRALGKITPAEALDGKSSAAVGAMAKERVTGKIEERLGYFEKVYGELDEEIDKRLITREARKQAGVALKEAQDRAIQAVRGNPLFTLEAQAGNRATTETYLRDVLNASNVRQLNSTITSIGAEIKKAARAGDDNLVQWLAPLRDSAKAAREAVLDAGGLAGRRKAIDSEYKAFKGWLRELAQETKSGRGERARDLLENLRRAPAERITDRLFDVRNVRALEFVRKNFPDAFEELARLKRLELATKAVDATTGRYQVGRMLTLIKNVPKEARPYLFSENQRRTLENLRRIYNAFPKMDNPGTAAAAERLRFYTEPIKYVTTRVADRAKLTALRAEEAYQAFSVMEETNRKIAQKFDQIPDFLDKLAKPAQAGGAVKGKKPEGVTDLSAKSLAVVLAMLGDDDKSQPKNVAEAYDRMRKQIQTPLIEPGKVEQKKGMIVQTIREGGAPQAAEAFEAASQQALRYLDQTMPKALVPPSLVNTRKFKPSDMEMSKFVRRVEAAMNPLKVLDDLRDGTLTREQVETLDAVYPEYMGKIRQRVVESLTEKQREFPYQAKLKLSLLLGMELDPSLSASSIQALQSTYQQQEAQAEQAGPAQPKMRPGAMKDVGVADRAASDADKVASRRV